MNYLESNLDSIDHIDKTIANSAPFGMLSSSVNTEKKTNFLPNIHFKNKFSSEKSQNKSIEGSLSKETCITSSVYHQPSSSLFSPTVKNSNSYRSDDKLKNNKLDHVDPIMLAEIDQFEANKRTTFVPTSKDAFFAERRLKVSINEKKNAERIGQTQIVNYVPRNKLETTDLENTSPNLISKVPMNVSNFHNNLISQSNYSNSKKNGVFTTWPCKYCTYKNPLNFEVCEMCNRSRTQGNESTPLVSGGRECSRCTLINEKEDKFCKACDTSLADSPTYI